MSGLDEVSRAWFDWAAAASWQLALLVCVIAALTFLLRNASPRLRYGLWMLVLVKALLPPTLAAFDRPMAAGFSWTGGGEQFPAIPDGKRPAWSADKKSCTLPVALKPNWAYRLGLNSPSFKNFASAEGKPLEPVIYEFRTGAGR